jgi:hypothetical protein
MAENLHVRIANGGKITPGLIALGPQRGMKGSQHEIKISKALAVASRRGTPAALERRAN